MNKTIPWNTGSGDIALTYNGQGNGTILVDTDDNNLFSARSQVISVKTGSITRNITVNQAKASYKLLEYVQNDSSNQLTFNDILPNDANWEFYGKFCQHIAFSGSWQNIIRAYTGENNNSYRIIRYNAENTSLYVNGNSQANKGTKILNSIAVGTPIEFYLKSGSITINGTTTTLGTTQGTALTSKLNINLGRWHELAAYHNGTMVYCFQPCVDENGKYGLVNVLTDTILYPTKGSFDSGGPEITRNFKDSNRNRIITADGKFFNVTEEE